jgi:hypothetical protein
VVFRDGPEHRHPVPATREVQAEGLSKAEVNDLEQAILARYEQLRREPTSTICVRLRQDLVENREPSGARQPTLLIRPSPPANGEPAHREPGPSRPTPAGWAGRLFADAARPAEEPSMPRFEARAVVAAIEELQALEAEAPEGLAVLLLAGYLALAEQVCRAQDAARAAVYALALRGLDRILPELPAGEGPGWKRGGLGTIKADTGAGRNRIGRMLARMIGLKHGAPGPT